MRAELAAPAGFGAGGDNRRERRMDEPGGPPPGWSEGGTHRCWAAAWPAAFCAAAHRRGPLPPRGQPRIRPLAVPAVTHSGLPRLQTGRAGLPLRAPCRCGSSRPEPSSVIAADASTGASPVASRTRSGFSGECTVGWRSRRTRGITGDVYLWTTARSCRRLHVSRCPTLPGSNS